MMIRRAANVSAGNRNSYSLWKVVGSRILLGSSISGRDGAQQQQLLSSFSGRQFDSPPCDSPLGREFGNEKSLLRDLLTARNRLNDASPFPVRNSRIAEEVCITGTADHRGWIGNSTSSLGFGYQGEEFSSFRWSSNKSGRSGDQIGGPLKLWKRVLSTKPSLDDDSSNISSEAKEIQTPDEAPARPKTIDDFQHEEIVGPTVERDSSDTANQLRESLVKLTTFMASLKTGFLLLGSVQMLAAFWAIGVNGVDLTLGLTPHFEFIMSFILAFLLRYFVSAVEFFLRVEERGRMRILTLSLQVNKMLVLFFYRSSFVVKAVAICSLLALLGDLWHSRSSLL